MRKVSIIIPIYNAERFLRETLDSIIGQTMKEWVCLLMNDGSTDNSVSICEEYVARDHRFLLHTLPNSGSADIPIGEGIKLAATDFISVVGHDDTLVPDYYERLFKRQEETNADIITAVMRHSLHELDGELWRTPPRSFDFSQVLSGEEAFRLTIKRWSICLNGMLCRTAIIQDVERFHYMCSDEFSGRQTLFKASKVAFVDVEYLYRNNDESISHKVAPRLWDRLIVDKQIEDFVLLHYSDEDIIENEVTDRFFNYVKLIGLYNIRGYELSKDNRQLIKDRLHNNYKELNHPLIRKYLPRHYFTFLLLGWWNFYVVSSIWCRIKHVDRLW